MSAASDAPLDADVPGLLRDASSWRSLAADVPGMQPQMVFAADLLSKTDPALSVQLSAALEAVGLEGVAHVSQLFSRLKSRYLSDAEHTALQDVAQQFFSQMGADLARYST